MIAILGGGLTGLSAAYHLRDLPHVVLEAEGTPGGLCRTREVGGFLFDDTGHLLHVRDPRAIALVDRLLPGAFRVVERRAFVRTRGVTVPFPFQANLHGLPPDVVEDCLVGFLESLAAPRAEGEDASFEEWVLATLGSGIGRAFLFPYAEKLFRREPSRMTADWVSWSVPRPTPREIVRGALGIRNEGMGYNATFRYPLRGGIGILPAALADAVGTIRCGARVVEADLDAREVALADGERIRFDRLVVTIPLPAFLGMVRGGGDLAAEAASLDWSVVSCFNLGVDRPGIGGGAHWIYFPDPDVPFYRVGFPTAFSDSVAPPGTSSLYVETGLSREETPDPGALEAAVIDGLRREGILEESDRILVRDRAVLDPGYVVFDRARRRALARILPALEASGVHAVGRYGAWTYSYMERALLDGIEVAERLRAAV